MNVEVDKQAAPRETSEQQAETFQDISVLKNEQTSLARSSDNEIFINTSAEMLSERAVEVYHVGYLP
jgi:hypothetical protein